MCKRDITDITIQILIVLWNSLFFIIIIFLYLDLDLAMKPTYKSQALFRNKF